VTNSYALDTGIVIRILRGDQRAKNLVTRLKSLGRIETSAVVAVEVIRGCKSAQEESEAVVFFGQPDIVSVSYKVAITAGRLMRRWRSIFSSDKAVPDAIIAASAIETSATLVTLNTRQFSRLNVPRLRLLLIDQQARDWAAQIP
jgi:predicted nucleic acid-binding protein